LRNMEGVNNTVAKIVMAMLLDWSFYLKYMYFYGISFVYD